MNIEVLTGDALGVKTGALVLVSFKGEEGPTGLLAGADKALDGAISGLIKQGEIKGKPGEAVIVHTLDKLPAARLVIAGLGKRSELTLDKARGMAAETLRFLKRRGIDDVSIPVFDIPGAAPQDFVQAITEGALLGTYAFRKYITRKENGEGEIKRLVIVAAEDCELSVLRAGVDRGRIVSEAAMRARDMSNEPGNVMTPTRMAEIARKLADEYGLELIILEKDEMQKMGMGALLAVAQGSCQPPKFIVLKYSGRQGDGTDLALVGKGITFDSGGISIKPSEKMGEMKDDMSGGAAVMQAISAIAALKVKLNVVAVVPAVENMPSGSAYRPGDIITAMNGKTIEVISTDAEGRLILADALCYANKLGPKAMIDVATLTGACIIALGKVCTGAFGNDQPLVDKVIAAGNQTGEIMWQMPMFEEYKEQNESDVADILNSGGRAGSAITAAQFLAEFVGDTKWVHLDIAGTSFADKEKKYIVKGGTGVPVRMLVKLAQNMASE